MKCFEIKKRERGQPSKFPFFTVKLIKLSLLPNGTGNLERKIS